jgi:hypothetical protein
MRSVFSYDLDKRRIVAGDDEAFAKLLIGHDSFPIEALARSLLDGKATFYWMKLDSSDGLNSMPV